MNNITKIHPPVFAPATVQEPLDYIPAFLMPWHMDDELALIMTARLIRESQENAARKIKESINAKP